MNPNDQVKQIILPLLIVLGLMAALAYMSNGNLPIKLGP